jgi:SepF-like predicted cell division protein (DUF552 family)
MWIGFTSQGYGPVACLVNTIMNLRFFTKAEISLLNERILIDVIIVSSSDDVPAISCPVYRGSNIILHVAHLQAKEKRNYLQISTDVSRIYVILDTSCDSYT